MDKLRELLAAKRKAAEEEFKGKKYVKRSEIEELRLAKLRAEEQREREAKVRFRGRKRASGPQGSSSAAGPGGSQRGGTRLPCTCSCRTPIAHTLNMQEAKRRQQEGGDSDGSRPASRMADPHARPDSRAGGAPTPPASLPREEVVRRLRALGEPVTLFGETDEQRFARMLLAEQNVQVGACMHPRGCWGRVGSTSGGGAVVSWRARTTSQACLHSHQLSLQPPSTHCLSRCFRQQ